MPDILMIDTFIELPNKAAELEIICIRDSDMMLAHGGLRYSNHNDTSAS